MSTFYCKRGGSDNRSRIEKIVIPFEKDGKTFNNGNFYFEHADYIGVMVNGQAVFIGRDKFHKDAIITEDSITFELPFWFIEKKSLEIFIDTSDTPSLF